MALYCSLVVLILVTAARGVHVGSNDNQAETKSRHPQAKADVPNAAQVKAQVPSGANVKPDVPSSAEVEVAIPSAAGAKPVVPSATEAKADVPKAPKKTLTTKKAPQASVERGSGKVQPEDKSAKQTADDRKLPKASAEPEAGSHKDAVPTKKTPFQKAEPKHEEEETVKPGAERMRKEESGKQNDAQAGASNDNKAAAKSHSQVWSQAGAKDEAAGAADSAGPRHREREHNRHGYHAKKSIPGGWAHVDDDRIRVHLD